MNESHRNKEPLGVLLFNLGGPETLDEVRPFLYNLFSDPDIVRLPWQPMQKPLAWLISRGRHRKSRSYYEKIGGGSPLRKITDEQATALEAALARRGFDPRVRVGMRYWKPYIEDALDRLQSEGVNRVIALPLYPQYSISTTGSSLNRMNQIVEQKEMRGLRISVVRNWQNDPLYISALAAAVREQLVTFSDQSESATHILFSAHSVPVSYIEDGDPYLSHTQETVGLVMERLGQERPHSLSFQSKVGPVKWLRPSTDETLTRLAGEGVSQVLVVPVSFVSEHIETLYELDILYRDRAAELNLPDYRRVPALNCRPDFIEALAGLVERAAAGDLE